MTFSNRAYQESELFKNHSPSATEEETLGARGGTKWLNGL